MNFNQLKLYFKGIMQKNIDGAKIEQPEHDMLVALL